MVETRRELLEGWYCRGETLVVVWCQVLPMQAGQAGGLSTLLDLAEPCAV